MKQDPLTIPMWMRHHYYKKEAAKHNWTIREVVRYCIAGFGKRYW